MNRERLLSLMGYDPAVLGELSAEERDSLRGAAGAWLVTCLLLGLAAGYAAYLVLGTPWATLLGAPGGALLTINLLRVATAGGGTRVAGTLERGRAACRRYRPSLIPAVVFGALAAMLAQPVQVLVWPELQGEVEEHRRELIAQHEISATALGTDPAYYRDELVSAGFPIFRMRLIWQHPGRALRMTLVACLLVLLPAFWTQVVSIQSVRAYEWRRYRRAHAAATDLEVAAKREATGLLTVWPTFEPVPRSGEVHDG